MVALSAEVESSAPPRSSWNDEAFAALDGESASARNEYTAPEAQADASVDARVTAPDAHEHVDAPRSDVSTTMTSSSSDVETRPSSSSVAATDAVASEHEHAVNEMQPTDASTSSSSSPETHAQPAADTSSATDASSAAQEPAAPVEAGESAPETAEACSYGLTGGWDGAREKLGDQGIEVKSSLIFEVNQIAEGGVDHESVGHSLFDLNLTFDLAKLAGWDDALIVADGYIINGRNPSADAGDFQSFSNISSIHVTQLAQLYLEKFFFDQKLRVKLGKSDVNADFGAPDSGGDFIHSSAAFNPTIVGFPTYPNPATCVVVSGNLTESWTLGAGVYDGATNAGIRTGGHGPSTFFGDPSDLFYVGELGHTWTLGEQELAGRFALGAWHHTGNFANFDGSTDDGTSGYYALVDQELARLGASDEPGALAGFVQWGNADSSIATIDAHVGFGLVASGCCADRPDDALGCYWSRVNFSDEAGFAADAETAFELFYKWQCCSWAVIKPDVQTITNPGGDATLDDALVFSPRVQIDF